MGNVIRFPARKRDNEELARSTWLSLLEFQQMALEKKIIGVAAVYLMADGSRKAMISGVCESEDGLAADLLQRMCEVLDDGLPRDGL
ncbi:hypothetical protein [Nitrogeniibacter aestuarii]|uniref:hypothetical protein n=1 Tax=Nitrogeniibacter aestuarii TaxID=2815343 RepID=UPI001D10F579|nr:hypothetical protein [Nitrogeniibacter aestuarii]